jgi:hypothetical protein
MDGALIIGRARVQPKISRPLDRHHVTLSFSRRLAAGCDVASAALQCGGAGSAAEQLGC